MRRLAPYGIGRAVFKPGTRPYIFYLELDEKALEAVGVLEKIVDVFARRGIPILQLKVSTPERLRILVIADLKGKEKLSNELARELKGLEHVIDAWHTPPIAEGVAVDEYSFPLVFMGERAIIIRKPVYEGFILSGWKRFGTPYAILLYLAGFEAGRRAYSTYSKLAKRTEEQLKLAEALFRMLGYGRLEILMLNDARKECIARVYNSFECELFKGIGEMRGNFVRGLIAGWLAARWGIARQEDITAREVKCLAKGDPYCEFRIWAGTG